MLDIVNEKDEVIGQDTRENIHKNGLLHREVSAWVFNSRGKVILQKRSMNKKSHPGLWSLSVSGHVESGDSYIISVIRELKEELGLEVKENELIELNKSLVDGNLVNDKNNNRFSVRYAYKFDGDINGLTIQKEELDEIKWWNIDELLNADEDTKKLLIPNFSRETIQRTLRKVKELSENYDVKITIVDEDDNVIGYKNMDVFGHRKMDIDKNDIYRVSALWITNSKGDILLAKRSLKKNHDPGKWGPAVAGIVDQGETYESTIIKEAEEEIGLKNIKPKIGPKIRVRGEHNYFDQWYLLEIDKPEGEFVLQESEVDEIKWFNREELKYDIETNSDKYLETMKDLVNKTFCK